MSSLPALILWLNPPGPQHAEAGQLEWPNLCWENQDLSAESLLNILFFPSGRSTWTTTSWPASQWPCLAWSSSTLLISQVFMNRYFSFFQSNFKRKGPGKGSFEDIIMSTSQPTPSRRYLLVLKNSRPLSLFSTKTRWRYEDRCMEINESLHVLHLDLKHPRRRVKMPSTENTTTWGKLSITGSHSHLLTKVSQNHFPC